MQKNKDTDIQVGDKIDITVDRRHFYKSTVRDVFENGFYLIGPPVFKGYQMSLQLFDEMYLVFYRESGRYITKMRVVDFQTRDDIRYSIIQQLTVPEKNQRREFYRLNATADAKLFEYTEGIEMALAFRDELKDGKMFAEARMRDISVSGVALLTKWACTIGDKYVIMLVLDESKNKPFPFFISAKVMRSEPEPESGMFDVGMQFFGLTKDKRDFLSKYIITQQQKKIMQIRLIEGE